MSIATGGETTLAATDVRTVSKTWNPIRLACISTSGALTKDRRNQTTDHDTAGDALLRRETHTQHRSDGHVWCVLTTISQQPTPEEVFMSLRCTGGDFLVKNTPHAPFIV